MAEDSDLERTEPASPRRLEEARNKGNIPRSRELNTFTVLMTAGTTLFIMGVPLAQGLMQMMKRGLTFDRSSLNVPGLMWSSLMQATLDMLVLFFPLLLALLVAALAAPMLLGGWLMSAEALAPDFGRTNPFKGLSRILSVTSLAELGKAIAKSLVVGLVGFWVIWHDWQEMLGLANESLHGGTAHMIHLLGWSFILITAGMILIVAIDVPFQLWEYSRKLRMTKEEVRQEMKESEGDPQLKGRIRAMQREAARKRMMSEVPKADVIVTNPTHYAVALRYNEKEMRAPLVVAKGSYLLAERIRELGSENGIPILRTPPLARALYKHAELDQEIPAGLFAAVAEVLAYVYQLRSYNKQGGVKPELPATLPVPEGMDIVEET
ncbi:flagellar biosynthetic protein FlhB [mine drainage metagenome]|uniref:Flagellar biosynthetic protein FlhB n=1 Tax=mine drainage metagenome TaxID=410659 RepID=A0A1J5QRD4_9ZZZZ